MTLRFFALSALLFVQIGVLPAGAQAVSQSNETIALSVGASDTIALRENPSTGYQWQVDTTESSNLVIVRVTDAGYQAVQGGQMGAAGSHWWRIEGRAPGTARIVFAYLRPWEHEAPAKSHTVEVSVTGGQ